MTITAEGEFLGYSWLNYLLSQPMMPFHIRIRYSDCLSDRKYLLPAKVVFFPLKIGQSQILSC